MPPCIEQKLRAAWPRQAARAPLEPCPHFHNINQKMNPCSVSPTRVLLQSHRGSKSEGLAKLRTQLFDIIWLSITFYDLHEERKTCGWTLFLHRTASHWKPNHCCVSFCCHGGRKESTLSAYEKRFWTFIIFHHCQKWLWLSLVRHRLNKQTICIDLLQGPATPRSITGVTGAWITSMCRDIILTLTFSWSTSSSR